MAVPRRYTARGKTKISGDRRQALFLDQGQQLQGWTGGMLISALPLADRVFRHVQIVRENRLAHLLALPERADFIGGEFVDRRQTRRVETPHRPLVDQADVVKVAGRLVNQQGGGLEVWMVRGSDAG